ncbi:hypothetical protein ATI61_101822 [Archangium gephyra]|uniref:Lipoprotein n=1 Tax=Archangium gephyra TaxID=48 RepID=A0AAC8QAI9_9BACT|nr:hypothetical protein [Archangium gephyra]AKJ04083.1 Hypothetical protein AA314_05709 [Archangium gephyra]REG37835.1 hypothetical protein ATI61_101822 [Archangium gephyra]
MSLLRWSRSLLALGLVVAGCKSNPPAAILDAGIAAAPAPDKVSSPTPTPEPITGPALSYLKPVDPERCAWMRRPLSSAEPTTLFTFDAACSGSELSWSPDLQRGLVFNQPTGEGARPRLWRVDFAAKTGSPVELKGLPGGMGAQGAHTPVIAKAGFDAQGRPMALVYVVPELKKEQDGEPFITFEGERYPAKGIEGTPALALAYRQEGADWKRFEAKVVSSETDSVDVLDAARLPGPNPFMADSLPGQKASESAARMLKAALPPRDKFGQWMALTTPGGTLFYRAERLEKEDTPSPSAPVRWEQDGKLVELEGLMAKEGDPLVLRLRGDLLVINVLGEGSRSAHVYDTRTKKNLASVQDVDLATLWPEPSRP